ncbi:dephospho-CoA kinase [Leptotrichia sp. oral taxon 847]|uniref:dephospho-CoA kinase n=1 Tax=Leptotrichia sp. oral taxon 847 TaxID=1785996 RepID=UPI000AE7B29C|nr:dephospho-CoA kinase [Leptotrichia sp. oral taxon 847]
MFLKTKKIRKIKFYYASRNFERNEKKIKEIKKVVVFVEIQLLFEVGWESEFDLILLIWSKKNIQIKRILERDGRSKDEAINIINSQISLDEKRKKSDYVIENNDDNLEKLENKVNEFIDFLKIKLNSGKKEV